MKDRVFVHQLRRGIGSAILELKQNDHRERYKPMVYRCCLKDIGFDTQVEGTKGHYLYTAIAALGSEDEFLPILAEVYRRRLSHRLMQQLTDILHSYVEDGYTEAAVILQNKYNQLQKQLKTQTAFPLHYAEREQFELLMIAHISLGKWKAFKRCVADANSIIRARRDDDCSYYDWFISHAEHQFGKNKVWHYFDSISENGSDELSLASEYRRVEQTREANQAELPSVTLKFLIEEVNKNSTAQRAYGMFGATRRFDRTASKEELVQLATYLEAENNPEVKKQLLQVFSRVDYPLDINPLMEMAHSAHEGLREAALEALGRLKDNQVHDLAVKLLEQGDIEWGLALFRSNWRKTDDPLIWEKMRKTSRVTHQLQLHLSAVYSKYKSASCKEILIHAYRNGECSYCRSDIIRIMGKNAVLPEAVLLECQYDSYEPTRKYAARTLSKRRKRGGLVASLEKG